MKESRKIEGELEQEELRKIANAWIYNSYLYQNAGVLRHPWNGLRVGADLWREGKENAKSYDTNSIIASRIDSGPEEFRIAEGVLRECNEFSFKVGKALQGVNYSINEISALERDLRAFIELGETARENLNLFNERYSDADLKKSAYEIRDRAIGLIRANFSGEFDRARYRKGVIALGALAGLIMGAGIGFGADKLGERYGLWYDLEWKRR